MSVTPCTEQDIISYLQKTTLPTLLVEGEADARIYRWIEDRLGLFAGSILICSGRETLISIYKKRNTFTHGKLAWLADLDMWVNGTVPTELSGIIFTSGYSIENDAYAGSEIENLLDSHEVAEHDKLLSLVCEWFAFEIQEYLANRRTYQSTHINQVIDMSAMKINPPFAQMRGFVKPSSNSIQLLKNDYRIKLRGKTLFQILVHFLSSTGRSAKYGHAQIIEMCLKLYPNNVYIKRLVSEAQKTLA